MHPSASRLQTLSPHFFAELESRIASLNISGKEIIRLDTGSPDLPPAAHIVQALAACAASPDAHGYQASRGTPALRQAWAEMYLRAYDVQLDPERDVLPLMGSKEGIFHLTQALISPGDVVIGPDPGYMTYRRAALFAGGEYYPMPLLPGAHYLPDLRAIPESVLERARLLWINYPHNPTGATAPVDFLAEVVEFARAHRLLLCQDAAYSQVTFDGYRAPSLLSIPGAMEVAVEFNSLSKSHNMAGWRVGAAVGRPEALAPLHRLMANVESGHFLPIIHAAVIAMTGDQAWIRGRNAVYQERRDIVVSALHAMGFTCQAPKAGLYVWFSVPSARRSKELASLLLDKAGVSLTPGSVFGERGEGYLRLSITQPAKRLKQAMERIEWVRREL